MDSPPANEHAQKLLGLELLRFLSAMAVLFWHFHCFLVDISPGLVSGPGRVSLDLPFHRWFFVFYEQGFRGVQIFWAISGYIFYRKYAGLIADRRVSLRDFFVLRFSRLYPLHLLTLAAVAVLQWKYLREWGAYFVYQYNDRYHFALQLLMASNWIGMEREYSFNGPIWSVSLEVLVYALFFGLCRFTGLQIRMVIVTLVVAALLKGAGVPFQILDAVGFFFLGSLTAAVSQTWHAVRHRSALLLVAWATVGALMAVWALLPDDVSVRLQAPVLIALIPPLLYVGGETRAIPVKLGWFAEFLGNLTYSTYLLHFPIMLCIVMVMREQGMAINHRDVGLFLSFMGLTLALGAIVYRAFEVPAQRELRARLGRKRSNTTVSTR